MIVDGFIFYNEVDILKIRLEELYPIVDRFVIVEASHTFRGNPKTSVFNENIDKFERYLDKITLIWCDLSGYYKDAWAREEAQRNAIGEGFKDLKSSDIVMVSDVDEIPRRSIVNRLRKTKSMYGIVLQRYQYGINIKMIDDNHTIKVLPYKLFTTAQEIRYAHPVPLIQDGGWEFTSVGSAEHIANKLKNYSHAELDIPEYTDVSNLQRRINNLDDMFDRNIQHERVEIDDSFPEEIKNNREYYKRLEL